MPPWGVHLNARRPARTPARGVACLGPEAARVPPDPPSSIPRSRTPCAPGETFCLLDGRMSQAVSPSLDYFELHPAGRETPEPGNGHRLGGKVLPWGWLRGVVLLEWERGRWGEGQRDKQRGLCRKVTLSTKPRALSGRGLDLGARFSAQPRVRILRFGLGGGVGDFPSGKRKGTSIQMA